MEENPYQSPQHIDESGATDLLSRQRRDVYSIALCQKVIQPGISVLFLTTALMLLLLNRYSGVAMLTIALVHGLLVLTAAMAVFVASAKMDGLPLGVLLALLTIFPCIGLVVLLIINQRAARLLQLNGIRIGWMGAKMEDVRAN